MPIESFKRFFRYEASAGIILFFAAVLALIIDNTAWTVYYQDLLTTHLQWGFKGFFLDKPLLLWINDGFMAVFFLLVGLEVKREMTIGELSKLGDALLPAAAAVGGMAIPALVYYALTHDNSHLLQGWAIPAATDIAFSLGVLALLSSRISPSLKLFLTALAIFDDVGAILIIALFYTSSLSAGMLIAALIFFLVLLFLNLSGVEKNWPYVVFGWLLWVCVLKSGVHATLAGIILAFAIPVKKKNGERSDMLERWEHTLHPWVAYVVLPIFAFANAGIRFADMELSSLWSGVTLACILGLFVGKQVGITGATWLAIKTRMAKLPDALTMRTVWGVSLVAGIGFTMSLFIGSLAFAEAGVDMMSKVRLGVIVGSLLSGMCGYLVLRFVGKK
jgi:NhaA family Na+:H+ antiporter